MRDTNQPFALSLSKGEHFFGCHPRESGKESPGVFFICRHSRESGNPGLEWYRAPCARSQQLIAVPRTAGGFLSLLMQRKKPKKARPGWRDYFLRFSPESALASTRRAPNTRLGLKHEARCSRFRRRCSAAATGI